MSAKDERLLQFKFLLEDSTALWSEWPVGSAPSLEQLEIMRTNFEKMLMLLVAELNERRQP